MKTECLHGVLVATINPAEKVCLVCNAKVRVPMPKRDNSPPDLGISVSEEIKTEDKMI